MTVSGIAKSRVGRIPVGVSTLIRKSGLSKLSAFGVHLLKLAEDQEQVLSAARRLAARAPVKQHAVHAAIGAAANPIIIGVSRGLKGALATPGGVRAKAVGAAREVLESKGVLNPRNLKHVIPPQVLHGAAAGGGISLLRDVAGSRRDRKVVRDYLDAIQKPSSKA